MSDERIVEAREQVLEIQKMAAGLAMQQQKLHDMIWKLRGNIIMM